MYGFICVFFASIPFIYSIIIIVIELFPNFYSNIIVFIFLFIFFLSLLILLTKNIQSQYYKMLNERDKLSSLNIQDKDSVEILLRQRKSKNKFSYIILFISIVIIFTLIGFTYKSNYIKLLHCIYYLMFTFVLFSMIKTFERRKNIESLSNKI